MKDNRAAFVITMTSCVYLLLGMTLGVFAAMKLLWPTLAEFELFMYPRIRMAHTNIVLFGWLLQVNMGLLLYIMPKLLHTKLYSQRLAYVMWAIHNLAVIGGITCILIGKGPFGHPGNKALEYAEMVPPFDYMIAVAWVLFGANIFMTLKNRNVKFMYVTVWYCVGSVIWTAFVYITGHFVTQIPGVAGMNQANLSWFYVHNVVGLVFTPLGVGIAYYLIPKELETPLYSHKLSLVGFWTIAFAYVWTGAHHMLHGPTSYWLQTVAILFSWSLIIPVIAVIVNFLGTYMLAPRSKRMGSAIAKFCYLGTIYYLLTCLQGPFQSIRIVNVYESKTDWVVGHAHLALLGAFSLFAFAGIYYVLPRVLGRPLFSHRLANLHFMLTFLGSIPFFGILFVSGTLQGMAWLDMEVTFLDTLRVMRPYHMMRWVAGATIFAAQLIFFYNIWETLFGKGAAEVAESEDRQVEPDEEPAGSETAEGEAQG